MKTTLIIIILATLTGCTTIDGIASGVDAMLSDLDPFAGSSSRSPGAVTPNAYGYGSNMDVYGRPHQYRTQSGETVHGKVKRNAYGLGTHMDAYGRPVHDSTP